MPTTGVGTFTYDNPTTLQIQELCEAKHAALKNIFLSAPQHVQNKYPSLPRAVYELLAIVLGLRESLLQRNPTENVPLPDTSDLQKLEELLAMSVNEIESLANGDLPALVEFVHSSLRADEELQLRDCDDEDSVSVTKLVFKWKLDATQAALRRRDLPEDHLNSGPAQTLPDDPPPRFKQNNSMDITRNSDLVAKKPKVLRVAGLPTGEHNEEDMDFPVRLGGPALILPSQIKACPGKTKVLLNVQEPMGSSIMNSFCWEGINLECVVRSVQLPKQSDVRPFSSEIEAVTLALCLHFPLCRLDKMEVAIVSASWKEIALRRLWALLEVQKFTVGPSPRTGEEALQNVLPSLEVYPDSGIRVTAMQAVVNRQISSASRARNAVRGQPGHRCCSSF